MLRHSSLLHNPACFQAASHQILLQAALEHHIDRGCFLCFKHCLQDQSSDSISGKINMLMALCLEMIVQEIFQPSRENMSYSASLSNLFTESWVICQNTFHKNWVTLIQKMFLNKINSTTWQRKSSDPFVFCSIRFELWVHFGWSYQAPVNKNGLEDFEDKIILKIKNYS